MSISNLTSQQIVCLNQVVHLIETSKENEGIDSAIKVLESENCLGELANKILQMIATYRHDDQLVKYKYPHGDLIKRIQECKGEQEAAYKVLMPDAPHQAVLNVATTLDLANKIASLVVPLTELIGPMPINHDNPITNRNGCFKVQQETVVFMQLERKTSLSLEEAHYYQRKLHVKSLAHVVKHCPALTHIDMTRALNEGDDTLLSAIATFCPHLESISLSYCTGFSEKGISELITKCPNLTSINLAHTVLLAFGLDSVLLAIAKSPTLKHINLTSQPIDYHSNYNSFTLDGLEEFIQNCTQLESINLSQYRNISDELLIKLTNDCPHLSHIELTKFYGVTDAGLAALNKNHPNLTIIALDPPYSQ
jgi:hypothetical protein